MTTKKAGRSWWQTLPGVLTAIAGIITAVTGLIVALNNVDIFKEEKIQVQEQAESNQNKAWLKIKGVNLFGRFSGAKVKVTADINGTAYVYPTLEGIEWVEVGPDMPSQQFLLPTSQSNYKVRFKMQVKPKTRRDEIEFIMVSTKTDIVQNLPFNGVYNLHRKTGNTRGSNIEGAVNYEISSDPN